MKTWARAAGDSIAQVGHWDLFKMSDLEWQRRKEVNNQVLQVLMGHSGIGVAKLNKALHGKRPNLISVCDSAIQKVLGITAGSKADRVVACTDEFRPIGRNHICALHNLRKLSKRLQAEITELRILGLSY